MMTTSGEPATVLIVEDHESLREFLTDTLERLGGYHVVAAADGARGLELAQSAPRPGCVIIDALMPELDGFQLIQALRGDPTTASLPLIMLTALAQDHYQFRGMAFGADRYIVKPVRPHDLIAAINEVMRMTDAQRLARLRTLAENGD